MRRTVVLSLAEPIALGVVRTYQAPGRGPDPYPIELDFHELVRPGLGGRPGDHPSQFHHVAVAAHLRVDTRSPAADMAANGVGVPADDEVASGVGS